MYVLNKHAIFSYLFFYPNHPPVSPKQRWYLGKILSLARSLEFSVKKWQ